MVGVLSDLVVRRQTDAALSIVLTVLTAYGAYIGAEELHVSGILAAVVAGVYAGYRSPRSLDADIRLNAVAFWSVLVFGLEITLFVLLGLQLPEIVDTLNETSSGVSELLLPAAALAAASIARPPRLRLRDGLATPAKPPASASRSAGAGCAVRSPSPPPWRCRSASAPGRRSSSSPSP